MGEPVRGSAPKRKEKEAEMGGYTARESRLREALAARRDPQERLAWVVEQARGRPPLPAEARTDDRLVPGCASRLWLSARLESGRCRLAVDSDSAILKAVAGLLCDLYDGLPASEVLEHEPEFLTATRLLDSLTENRRRTIQRVRGAIREFARRSPIEGGGDATL